MFRNVIAITVGLAFASVASIAVAQTETTAPGPAVAEPVAVAPSARRIASPGHRRASEIGYGILGEIGGAAVGALVGGFSGLLIGSIVDSSAAPCGGYLQLGPCLNQGQTLGLAYGTLIGSSLALLAATNVFVFMRGRHWGGEGSLLATLAVSLAVTASLEVPAALLATRDWNNGAAAMITFALIGPVVGAVWGYEASNGASRTAPRWVPAINVSNGQATAGVMGAF